jgi:hypothetical protein
LIQTPAMGSSRSSIGAMLPLAGTHHKASKHHTARHG